MKKFLSILLAVAMLCMASAFAAEIYPVEGTVVTSCIPDGTMPVHFSAEEDFMEDNTLYITVYENALYDAVECGKLAVGDSIYYIEQMVTIDTIDTEDGYAINGGWEEGGITLWPNEGGTYIAMEGEFPVYVQLAAAVVEFADEVTFTHWQLDEEGGIKEDMAVEVIPATELKDAMIAAGFPSVYPNGARITIENGVITELTINYTP